MQKIRTKSRNKREQLKWSESKPSWSRFGLGSLQIGPAAAHGGGTRRKLKPKRHGNFCSWGVVYWGTLHGRGLPFSGCFFGGAPFLGLFPPFRFFALANLDEYGVFKEAAARLSAAWPLPFRTLGASLCSMLKEMPKGPLRCALAFGTDRGGTDYTSCQPQNPINSPILSCNRKTGP